MDKITSRPQYTGYELFPKEQVFSLARQNQIIAGAKVLAMQITSKFEGGRFDSLQTQDAGIISYGKHQATLKSGNLHLIVKDYTENSSSNNAMILRQYLPFLEKRDPTLKNDGVFLTTLKFAANEPAMQASQKKVFDQYFWEPVVSLAKKENLLSKEALAILYDTKIQGGLDTILSKTKKTILPDAQNPKPFLNEFLNQRATYLRSVAATKRLQGDEVTAKMLERDMTRRVGGLRDMLK